MGFEMVRVFFFAHQNYSNEVDVAAEALAAQAQSQGAALAQWLIERLAQQHSVRAIPVPVDEEGLDVEEPFAGR